MTDEEMKELLKEMQANCVKGMLKGAIYEDEKAERKAVAIELALNLIEKQQAEIEKKDRQLQEKENIIRKVNIEAQKYFDMIMEMQKEIHDYKEQLQMFIPRRRVRRVYKMLGKILRTDISPELLEEDLKKKLVEGGTKEKAKDDEALLVNREEER